jgi:F-box interacting protein
MERCFPADVLAEILQRLPPSSRRRSRLVCRRWRDTVDTHTTEMQSRAKVLIWDTRNIVAYIAHETSSPTGSYRELWTPNRRQRPFFQKGLRLVGTCNGLLCLCDSERTPRSAVTVVNPTTGEALPLPPLAGAGLFDVGCRNHGYGRERWHESYSFAYHPITGQYKVLHVPCRSSQSRDFNAIQIFTLGETTWRDVPVGEGDARCNLAAGIVSVDSTTYWVSATPSGVTKLVCFDLDDERVTSSTMPLPTPLARGESYHLTEVHGRLGFVRGGDRADVWVLEEGRRWSRRYNLGHSVPRPQFAYAGQCVLTVHNKSLFRAHRWKGPPLSSGWRPRCDGVVRIGHREEGTLVANMMPSPSVYFDDCYHTFAYVETKEPLSIFASN